MQRGGQLRRSADECLWRIDGRENSEKQSCFHEPSLIQPYFNKLLCLIVVVASFPRDCSFFKTIFTYVCKKIPSKVVKVFVNSGHFCFMTLNMALRSTFLNGTGFRFQRELHPNTSCIHSTTIVYLDRWRRRETLQGEREL